jgi:autotransporter translocation and assembly factor TamB
LPKVEKLHIEGRRLDGSKVCGIGAGILKGTIDEINVDMKPTTIEKGRKAADWLAVVSLYASAKKVTFATENYSGVSVCINRNDDGRCRPSWAVSRLAPTGRNACEQAKKSNGACIVASADRDLGGRFAATIADLPPTKIGRVAVTRTLGGTIALDDLPLAVFQPVLGQNTLGGLVSATLHLGGDRDAPSVEIGSTINLTRSWIAGAYIGDMQLGVIPQTFNNVNAIRIYGTAMAGQLSIDGIVGTAAPYPVDVALRGRRLEVDHFVDLTQKLHFPETLQAWATGTVTVHADLDKKSTKEPEAWVELEEVEAIGAPVEPLEIPAGPGRPNEPTA